MVVPFTAAIEHDVLRMLRAAGARSDASAAPLPDLTERQVEALDRLIDAGAVVVADEDRYYVDETHFDPMRRRGRVIRIVLWSIVGAYAAIVAAGMWRTR